MWSFSKRKQSYDRQRPKTDASACPCVLVPRVYYASAQRLSHSRRVDASHLTLLALPLPFYTFLVAAQ